MKLQIGMDSMLKLLREFINQTGFALWRQERQKEQGSKVERRRIYVEHPIRINMQTDSADKGEDKQN